MPLNFPHDFDALMGRFDFEVGLHAVADGAPDRIVNGNLGAKGARSVADDGFRARWNALEFRDERFAYVEAGRALEERGFAGPAAVLTHSIHPLFQRTLMRHAFSTNMFCKQVDALIYQTQRKTPSFSYGDISCIQLRLN